VDGSSGSTPATPPAPRRRRGRTAAALTLLLTAALLVPEALSRDSDPGVVPAVAAAGTTSTTTTLAPEVTVPPAPKVVRPPVTIALGGDVYFQGRLGVRLARDPATALAEAVPLLAPADVTIVNLETAVTTRGAPEPKQYRFRTSPTAFTALRGAGVDVVTMANNHGLDYGLVGVDDAVAGAAAAGVPLIGIGRDEAQALRPAVVEARGWRIAVLAATDVLDSSLAPTWAAGPGKPGLASAKDPALLLRAVADARRTADLVVVFLHWGVEGEGCPSTRQQDLAAQLVAAGADVVAGSHAHRQQGAGRLVPAVVGYGLGNLAFFNRGGLDGDTGVLEVTASPGQPLAHRWVPAKIRSGAPVLLAGPAAAAANAQFTALRACTGLAP
jgi:hypothetical protein